MAEKIWKLTNEEYEFVKGEVCHLFVKYDVTCVPVCGFEIAEKMGIVLKPYSAFSARERRKAMKMSKDGFFSECGGRVYIFYNDVHNCYERQNWTILHEIGHIVLDHMGGGKHEEDEADFFAKYAIAPPVLIHLIGARSSREIYERFNISHEASVYAYKYYVAWRRRHRCSQNYTDYEMRLLNLYKKHARVKQKKEMVFLTA